MHMCPGSTHNDIFFPCYTKQIEQGSKCPWMAVFKLIMCFLKESQINTPQTQQLWSIYPIIFKLGKYNPECLLGTASLCSSMSSSSVDRIHIHWGICKSYQLLSPSLNDSAIHWWPQGRCKGTMSPTDFHKYQSWECSASYWLHSRTSLLHANWRGRWAVWESFK